MPKNACAGATFSKEASAVALPIAMTSRRDAACSCKAAYRRKRGFRCCRPNNLHLRASEAYGSNRCVTIRQNTLVACTTTAVRALYTAGRGGLR